jgi:hypothetical protein
MSTSAELAKVNQEPTGRLIMAQELFRSLENRRTISEILAWLYQPSILHCVIRAATGKEVRVQDVIPTLEAIAGATSLEQAQAKLDELPYIYKLSNSVIAAVAQRWPAVR